MKWRPKGGKPLAVGCNARLDPGLVSEAGRCGELRRPAEEEGFIEVDEAAAAEVALDLVAWRPTMSGSEPHGPPRPPECAAQRAREKGEPPTGWSLALPWTTKTKREKLLWPTDLMAVPALWRARLGIARLRSACCLANRVF